MLWISLKVRREWNPLGLNISMRILLTVLLAIHVLRTRRICLKTKPCSSRRKISFLSRPCEHCYFKKKLQFKCCHLNISLTGGILSKIDVHNPVFDYIPPDLVNLCISNMWVCFLGVASSHHTSKNFNVSGTGPLFTLFPSGGPAYGLTTHYALAPLISPHPFFASFSQISKSALPLAAQ